jgi:colanic acid/amylovoran biosynthesis glycosyltransferase
VGQFDWASTHPGVSWLVPPIGSAPTAALNRMRIGYLIPEFPGQTHIFFWREMRALRDRGVGPEVVSTRLPAAKLITHAWADEARARTRYLSRPTARAALGAVWTLLRAGPRRWWRCVRAVAAAEGGVSARARLLPLVAVGAHLGWLARSGGWAHLHVHSCATSAQVAVFAHLLTGLPYSLTLHGPLADYGPNQCQKWRHAAFALIITRRLIDEAGRELAGSLPPVVRVAPMGVELDRFVRAAPYQPWVGSGAAVVFSCGRLNPCKGHDVLVRAVALLRAKGVPVELRIAGEDDGDGSHRALLERLAAETGLGERVRLLGAVPEETVRRELEGAHVFALASRAEPLGVVIMEAMAIELPVVATSGGGVPELVDDGVDGLLVPPGDPRQLAEALARVLQDAALAARLSAAARRKVRTAFHSGRSAEVLCECLGVAPVPPAGA